MIILSQYIFNNSINLLLFYYYYYYCMLIYLKLELFFAVIVYTTHGSSKDPRYLSRYSNGLHGRGSISGKVMGFVSTPQRPDRLCGPRSLISNGYRGLFPRE
jgi:hypothetical protein